MAVFNGPAIETEIIDEILKSVGKPEDLLGKDGVLKQLTARLVERMLQAELTEHLGYESGERKSASSGNGRNGYTAKTVATDEGPVSIDVPRDRRVTDAVVDDIAAWQGRPLDAVYPIVHLDALVVKVRDQGVVRKERAWAGPIPITSVSRTLNRPCPCSAPEEAKTIPQEVQNVWAESAKNTTLEQ
jgi:transposase-like protein